MTGSTRRFTTDSVSLLPVADRQRAIDGFTRLTELGPRIVSEYALEIARRGCDEAEALDLLDRYRTLTPAAARALGWPPGFRPSPTRRRGP
jgi:hypothetical protein